MSHNSDPLLGPVSFLYKIDKPGSKVVQYGHSRNVSSEFQFTYSSTEVAFSRGSQNFAPAFSLDGVAADTSMRNEGLDQCNGR